MSGNWPKDPWRHNPDAPYRQGDVIRVELGNEPPQWEVLCVGWDTYYLKSLTQPSYMHPHETIWNKWSCEQVTKLVSRGS